MKVNKSSSLMTRMNFTFVSVAIWIRKSARSNKGACFDVTLGANTVDAAPRVESSALISTGSLALIHLSLPRYKEMVELEKLRRKSATKHNSKLFKSSENEKTRKTESTLSSTRKYKNLKK